MAGLSPRLRYASEARRASGRRCPQPLSIHDRPGARHRPFAGNASPVRDVVETRGNRRIKFVRLPGRERFEERLVVTTGVPQRKQDRGNDCLGISVSAFTHLFRE